MENKSEISLQSLFEKKNIKKLIIILGITAMALIFLSTLTDFRAIPQGNTENTFSAESYCENLQSQLKAVLMSMEGVGRVKILLTIENSTEVVYQERTENQTKQIEPKIRGVVVVCDGGSDPVVVQSVINALQSALDISASKICVTQLSDSNYREE